MRQIRLALRVARVAPLPVAVQPREPRGAPGLPAPPGALEHSAFAGDLLLFLKVLTGLGYGNDARVRAAVGYEMRCEVAEDGPSAERTTAGLGDLRPARGRRGVRRGDRRLGRRRRGRGGDPRRGRTRGRRARGRPLHGPPQLPRRAARGAGGPLPRRRPDDRRGPPGDPDPGRPRGRRDHGDQLGHLLPGPRAGARRLARPSTASNGPRELDADYAEAEEMLDVRPVDPERMGRNGQLLLEGAEALGVRHEPLHRNAGACHQCSSCPAGCRLDAKRAMHVSYLPRAVAAGARVRAERRGSARRLRAGPRHGRRLRVARARDGTRARSSFGPGARWCSRAARSGPRSCCCGRGSARRAGSSAATCGSTPPAGWARASPRRCGAGTA